jgi:hypothetical protein
MGVRRKAESRDFCDAGTFCTTGRIRPDGDQMRIWGVNIYTIADAVSFLIRRLRISLSKVILVLGIFFPSSKTN